MDDSYLISIIIPVYNIEHYLNRCINSIINQTYQKLEIILVDDGSSDNSGNICDSWKYKDARIKVIHKMNEGVSKARQAGIDISTGDYLGFVDGDDYIENDMYELLIRNAIKYNADISHCGYRMLFDDGREKFFYGTKKFIIQDNYDGQKDLLSGDFIEPGLWNKLYRKELFIDLRYDETIKINEDLMINFLLFQKSSLSVYTDVCKYNYCIRKSSASRKELNFNKIYDPIYVREFIKNKVDPSLTDLANIRYLYSCINSYTAISLSKKDFKNDKKAIRKLIINNKDYALLCDKKRKILFSLIVYFPFLYPMLYKIYYKYFQVKLYE